MLRKVRSPKLLSLTTCALISVSLLVCFFIIPSVSSHNVRLEQELASHFLQHQTVKLDAAQAAAQVQQTGRLSLATGDVSFDLELTPHDLRGAGYRAEEFGDNGLVRRIDTGPVRTFKGQVQGIEGGQARFTIDRSVVEGMIITPEERYYVEPASRYSKAAKTTDYVIYKESDVLTSSVGACGVTMNEQVNQRAKSISAPLHSDNLKGINAAALPLQELRVATEADNEYVLSKGGAAAADQAILRIMNQVEGLYEIELGLTMKVVYQSAWSTASSPYSETNPSALLGQLSEYWNTNRGSVARDVVHMWTGKKWENATLGTAYLKALRRYAGSGRAAYGLSKGVAGSQEIAITAHEIGHNLGATHPNQQQPPVPECNNTIMSSSLSASPQLQFCQYSMDEIAKYLSASSSCLNASTSQFGFAVQSIYPTGSSPQFVAVGDFNDDGIPDLAVANLGSNDVSILLGTAAGTFQPAINYSTISFLPFPGGKSPRSVAVGDFNNDGYQDLVVAASISPSSRSSGVSILLGTGTGSFQAAVNYGINGGAQSVAVGEFNADGNQDIAVTVAGLNGVTVLLGTGTGSFQGGGFDGTGSSSLLGTASVAVGDFNGDGKQDLAAANINGVMRLLGNSNSSCRRPISTNL